MNDKILIINIGSASKKYAIYQNGKLLLASHFEHNGRGGFVASFYHDEKKEEQELSESKHRGSLPYLIDYLIERRILGLKEKLFAVGIRVVAPGQYFKEHRKIDDEYIKKLEEAADIAPLHIEAVLSELKEMRRSLPEITVVGCSDSAFHSTILDVAKNYAISEDVVKKYGIYRYGYHGLSIESAVKKLRNMNGGVPTRTIVCHLGSGSSVTALKNGQSTDTSMGFTPLEGLPMGSRVGSIDAEAVLFLGRSLDLSFEKLSEYLNTKSGLLGLSGKTSDVRELLRLEQDGDAKCKLALDMFIYSVKKYIGAYMATLGGLDALVFTGTVGERSHKVRARVCSGLEEFGIRLDQGENVIYEGNKDGSIQSTNSQTSIIVLSSDETGVMERITRMV